MLKKQNAVFFLCLSALSLSVFPAGAQEITVNSAAEAVEMAVQNSRTWTIGRQKILAGMGMAKMGIQDFLPSFGLSLSESDSISILAGDSRSKTIRLSVSQPVFDGGKKKLAYEAGRLSALYQKEEFEAEYRGFLSTVMSLYYQCLLLDGMAEIRRDLLAQAGEQLAILKKETELGLSLETDYLEYAASYMEIEQELDQGLRDLLSAERQLKAALGLEEGVSIKAGSGTMENQERRYYEPWLDRLWALVRESSGALKKLSLDVEYGRKERDYGKRWYIPAISAQGSVTFSGNSYPLTEPNYSVQFTFDFSGLDFFSLNASRGAGFERSSLRQLSNSHSGELRILPAYPLSRKQGELNLLESTLRLSEGERELREALYELVIAHDNKLRAADNMEQRIALMEKRLRFSRLQLEKGEKKRIDYLSELSGLAQARISLRDYLTQVSALERDLEIQTGFPFGGLSDACRNQ
ncbi:MAG: TolC family protein [Treponema sp.]|jgi:outer membrane protein TolC|nr:TolC family protein [Treponema sp.]